VARYLRATHEIPARSRSKPLQSPVLPPWLLARTSQLLRAGLD
jgi:hypothetical protein